MLHEQLEGVVLVVHEHGEAATAGHLYRRRLDVHLSFATNLAQEVIERGLLGAHDKNRCVAIGIGGAAVVGDEEPNPNVAGDGPRLQLAIGGEGQG